MKYAVILVKSPSQHMVFCSFDCKKVTLDNYTGTYRQAIRLKKSLKESSPDNAYRIIGVVEPKHINESYWKYNETTL